MLHLTYRLLALIAVGACSAIACEDPVAVPGGTGGQDPMSGGGTAGSAGDGAGPGGESAIPAACRSDEVPFVVLADERNNMTFSSTITLRAQKVPPQDADLTMDWSELTKDFLGHDLAFQGGMKAAVLVVWDIPVREVAMLINADDPQLDSHVFASLQFDTDATVTSAPLTSFTSFGATVEEATFLDYLDPDNDFSYTLMAQAHPTVLGRDVQMIQAFALDAAASSTTVRLTDTSTTLDWEADLDTLLPTPVPPGQSHIEVDWFSSILQNSFGGVFVNNQITEVLVGRYDASVDLEEQFLDIELDATELWRSPVSAGSRIDLATLTNEDGAEFGGVPADSDDQWLLGLLCTTCVNPTPWYVTRLEACP